MNRCKIFHLFLILILIIGCRSNWNDKFVEGKINREEVLKELPIGSSFNDLAKYIKRNKIPKRSKQQWGYTEKIFNLSDEFGERQEVKNKALYHVKLEGHIDYSKFPHYYHPILFLFFDKNDKLILIDGWGYP